MSEEPAGTAPAGTRIAGFGRRLLGWIVDGLIAVVFFVPSAIALALGPRGDMACHVDLKGHIDGLRPVNATCTGPTTATWAAAGLLLLLAIAGVLAYQGLLAGGPRGQTLGMRAVGVRLVDRTTFGPVGGATAVARYVFGMTISGWMFSLGYLWALGDVRRQTWHDKATSALVIRA